MDSNGAGLIAVERSRQIEKEGWTAGHDDDHRHKELVSAAICYAKLAAVSSNIHMGFSAPRSWPWERKSWKPSNDSVKNLVKAGALIAAEIDRLLRKSTATESSQSAAPPTR